MVEYFRCDLRSPVILVLILASGVGGCALPTDSNPEPFRTRDAPWTDSSEPRIPVSEGAGRDSSRALIYTGASTWFAEVDSLERNLRDHGMAYEEQDASVLNFWDETELSRFNLLIIAGGYAPSLTSELKPELRSLFRAAVRAGQMGYLGFCAGAWLAVSPPEPTSEDRKYGIGFIDGPVQQIGPPEREGLTFSVIEALLGDGRTRRLLWWGGPTTPSPTEGEGSVLARYPDGSPAISKMRAGLGWIVISGLHPTATPEILASIGSSDLEPVAPDFTWSLIQAALDR